MSSTENRRAIEDGLAALRQGDPAKSAAILRPLVDEVPGAQFPWTALANAEILLERHDAASVLLDRRLAQTPRDVAILLQRAWLYEKAGKTRAAVSFYRTALSQTAASAPPPPQLTGLIEHTQRYCAQAGDTFGSRLAEATAGELSSAMQVALGLLRGERSIDLQQPSVFYYPGLPQKRFFDQANFAWLAPMLALLPAMRAEWEAIAAEGTPGFVPEHEARNAGPEERVVLLFEIWRPEIPPEDRAAIVRIFEAIQESGL